VALVCLRLLACLVALLFVEELLGDLLRILVEARLEVMEMVVLARGWSCLRILCSLGVVLPLLLRSVHLRFLLLHSLFLLPLPLQNLLPLLQILG
jgi:hypothetical protein